MLQVCSGFGARCRQFQLFIQLEGLLPCFHRQAHLMGLFQKLHIIWDSFWLGNFNFIRAVSLHPYCHIGPHHQPSWPCHPGIHTTKQAVHPHLSFLLCSGYLPSQLHRDPGFHHSGIAAILRGIQHPNHCSAADACFLPLPLLAPQNTLSPSSQDSAHIRQTFRELYLLGLFLGLHILFYGLQARNACVRKMQFQIHHSLFRLAIAFYSPVDKVMT